MPKRSKLEIIQNILNIIKDNNNSIKPTPLLRKTNLSSVRFKEYYTYLINKQFIFEIEDKQGNKRVSLTDKGYNFLSRYKSIVEFINEFEL
ncbi:hypothetical protein J4467_03055 [Candidatus Woesearchaeota archaeon]|nr:hypothetical protein [Candidatus Woesearchaeota archaeon]